MPVSSVSALNSWGVYIVASAALVLMLSPLLAGAARDSRESADLRTADGVREALDSLQPGVTLSLYFGNSLASDPVQLHGSQVSCSYGSGTVSLPSRWALPTVTLMQSVHYHVWLSGAQVQVAPVG